MRTLIKFKLFVAEIQASNSKKYKQTVLQKFKDDEDIKRYLKIAFDPYQVYGIASKKLHKDLGYNGEREDLNVFELFDYLAEHNTGSTAEIVECQLALEYAAKYDLEASYILEKLICKDLSLGIEAKSINSVFPSLIPTFDVQLAQKYFEKPERLEGKYFAVTTKIDGGRIIAIKDEGKVQFYTRAGQKYEGLVDLEQEMLEAFPDGTVLDGEITILNNKGIPSKEAYKQAMKITRADGEKHGLKMLVFDAMSLEEWKKQKCTHSYIERRLLLSGLFKYGPKKTDFTFFELLPELYRGSDTSKVLELLDEAIENKEEGVMINICDAPYEFGRTWNLMKVKKMNTLDLEVIGYEEGSGRLAGTLGALLVRYKNGNTVKVGSGFTDELRALIWLEPLDMIGKIIEVQYFEETTNADGGLSLRFPVFKDFRPDKLVADF
jgi:DNA ligase-1